MKISKKFYFYFKKYTFAIDCVCFISRFWSFTFSLMAQRSWIVRLTLNLLVAENANYIYDIMHNTDSTISLGDNDLLSQPNQIYNSLIQSTYLDIFVNYLIWLKLSTDY